MEALKEYDPVAKYYTEDPKYYTDDPMGKQGLWHFPSKKVTRRKKCRNHGNTSRSFSVNERRERHCGQSREEDGVNVKKSGRSNVGRIYG